MTIYEPVFDTTGIYSGGVARDSAYGKQTKFPSYRLAGARGRFGAIATGIGYARRYFGKHPKRVGYAGSAFGGYLVASKTNARSNQFNQALRTTKYKYNRFRKQSKHRSCRCCCQG